MRFQPSHASFYGAASAESELTASEKSTSPQDIVTLSLLAVPTFIVGPWLIDKAVPNVGYEIRALASGIAVVAGMFALAYRNEESAA